MGGESSFSKDAARPEWKEESDPLVSAFEDFGEDARNESQRFAADREKIENPIQRAIKEEKALAQSKGNKDRVRFLERIEEDFDFPPEETRH